MEKKKYGVFTPATLMLYSETNIDSPINFLKRNAVLYENLILIPTGLGKLDGSGIFTKQTFLKALAKEKIKYEKDFYDLFFRIEDLVNKESELKNYYMPRNREKSMWEGTNSSKYIKFIMEYVQKKNGYDTPEIRSREHKKELEYYVGTISTDFQILAEASQNLESTSGLFSEIHEKAFIETYGFLEKKTETQNILTSVENINHFDFGSLSWDEIIILRKSEFVNDFRSKVWDWIDEFGNFSDSVQIEEYIEKYIDDAKFDFIEKKKPNLSKSILTGIFSNIPLPIFVNPVGIVSSAKQIINEEKEKKDFGWLLFIQKARKNSR